MPSGRVIEIGSKHTDLLAHYSLVAGICTAPAGLNGICSGREDAFP
jgi:hypothetical protein